MRIIHRVIVEELKELERDGYLLIQGLPGVGLVGFTIAEFLTEEFENELALTVIPYDSRPLSTTSGKTYMATFAEELRIYEITDDAIKRPLLVFTGRKQPDIAIYDTLNAILDVIGDKLSDLVAVGGMTGSTNDIGAFTYSEDVAKRLEEKGVPPIEVDIMHITGAVAVFPKLAIMRGIRARGLLSKIHEERDITEFFEISSLRDPLASKRAMKLLNEVYDLGIPEEKFVFFDKKAEDARKKYEEIAKAMLRSMRETSLPEKLSDSIHEGEEDKYYV